MTHKILHIHTGTWRTHTFLSEREYFLCVDFICQCKANLIAATCLPSQSNVKTGMQAPHLNTDRKKEKNIQQTFKVFSSLIGHSIKVKLVIQSLVFAHNDQAFSSFLIYRFNFHAFMLYSTSSSSKSRNSGTQFCTGTSALIVYTLTSNFTQV